MKKFGARLFLAGILAALASPAVAETRTISWDPVTTYTDNTPIEAWKTVSYTVYWTTDIGLSPSSLRTVGASIAATSTTFDPDLQGMTRGGTVYFTMKTVLSTGEASVLSPRYAWIVPAVVSPPPPPPPSPAPGVLTGIAVSGPSSVNERGTATYTATGTWDNGTTASVAPAWSVSPATYASIGAGGVLTSQAVTSNQAVTVTGTYTNGGVTRTATLGVTILHTANVLTGIAVSGPSSVTGSGTAAYTATGTWDNGTTAPITPTWSVSTSYATISPGGLLTAGTVTANQVVTVTAVYGGRTGTIGVTIVSVPVQAPAAAMNVGISGPRTSGGTELWRLSWDGVTTYVNGVLLEAGRTVRYAAFWTADPALSVASLRQLAPPVTATHVDFDPIALQMPVNQPVYLTVQAILDNGNPSSLAVGVEWVVANAGPVAPVRATIIKKK